MTATRPPLQVDLGWGADALRDLSAESVAALAAVVVIDVLSFSTSVDIATARGATVFPWHEDGPSAIAAAHERRAVLAARRSTAGASPWTLSPASQQTIPPGTRLLLPSPNGATLSSIAQAQGLPTVAGCLRNASAVAHWLAQRGGRVLLVPAGEWTRYNALGAGVHGWRNALEDWLGAGAIASALRAHGATLTDDAQAATARFARGVSDLHTQLRRCASGQELLERGFLDDVRLAAKHDISTCVPLLTDGYSNARSHPPPPA